MVRYRVRVKLGLGFRSGQSHWVPPFRSVNYHILVKSGTRRSRSVRPFRSGNYTNPRSGDVTPRRCTCSLALMGPVLRSRARPYVDPTHISSVLLALSLSLFTSIQCCTSVIYTWSLWAELWSLPAHDTEGTAECHQHMHGAWHCVLRLHPRGPLCIK